MNATREKTQEFDELKPRVAAHWRRGGYTAQYLSQCLRWVQRFYDHHDRRLSTPTEKLTRPDALRFAQSYARKYEIKEAIVKCNAQAALSLWHKTIKTLGVEVPPWEASPHPPEIQAILAEFREWSRTDQAIKESSIDLRSHYVGRFLATRGRRLRPGCSRLAVTTADIDKFVAAEQKIGPVALPASCTALRSFLRFLHATGRTPTDMSPVVGSVRTLCVTPPRAIPWKDVLRILAAVDRRRSVGKRDYAMLLLMASYGMGRSEVSGLSLDDIDWHARTLRIVRTKSDVEVELPLSDDVATALASYLQRGRPASGARRVFLRTYAPYTPLVTGSISRIVGRYASSVGISASSHTFRHSHACRQVELNAPPKTVSDILGHTNPESLSSYVRVAKKRLRALCLPLPT